MTFLIADEMHPSLMPILGEMGVQCHYSPTITRKEITDRIGQYEGLIIRSKTFVDAALLTKADRLKYICRAGAGLDNLDIDYINSKGIVIINAPEGNRNALAEHCAGLLFALLNNIVKADTEVRSRIWARENNRGHEISGKTIAIIGYGHMGSAFADKLSSFGCKILAYDKYKTNYTHSPAQEASLPEIFDEADIVSLHIPLTKETRHMADQHFFDRFKKPIWLINTSRGGVLSLKALKSALESQKVIGAALDVLENEKLDKLNSEEAQVFDYLAKSNRVILTPHIGGWTFESYQRINEVMASKLRIAFAQKRN